jgi:hypothetical protein
MRSAVLLLLLTVGCGSPAGNGLFESGVPGSSGHVEDAAYLPFLLDEDEPFRPIEELDRRLRAPLKIRYGQ